MAFYMEVGDPTYHVNVIKSSGRLYGQAGYLT